MGRNSANDKYTVHHFMDGSLDLSGKLFGAGFFNQSLSKTFYPPANALSSMDVESGHQCGLCELPEGERFAYFLTKNLLRRHWRTRDQVIIISASQNWGHCYNTWNSMENICLPMVSGPLWSQEKQEREQNSQGAGVHGLKAASTAFVSEVQNGSCGGKKNGMDRPLKRLQQADIVLPFRGNQLVPPIGTRVGLSLIHI